MCIRDRLGGIAFLAVDVALGRTEAVVAGCASLLVLLVLLVGIPRFVARDADDQA